MKNYEYARRISNDIEMRKPGEVKGSTLPALFLRFLTGIAPKRNDPALLWLVEVQF
ncbi:MAG: hypothetical protein WAV32_03075 [Halobacteriota archaeon]